MFGAARSARKGQRVLISLFGLLMMAGAIVAANFVMSDRLADLSAVAGGTGDLIRSPDEFSASERELMSGRLYLWNAYFDEYKAGTDTQLLIGRGADAWVEVFGLYAHNTLVSYLYEFGLIGTLLLVLVWLSMIARALRVQDWALRGQLVCAHVGFVLLNMATMPFWQLEGLILYGLLCGFTYAASLGPAFAPVRPERRPRERAAAGVRQPVAIRQVASNAPGETA